MVRLFFAEKYSYFCMSMGFRITMNPVDYQTLKL